MLSTAREERQRDEDRIGNLIPVKQYEGMHQHHFITTMKPSYKLALKLKGEVKPINISHPQSEILS
jgi:hypothetical protein